MSAIDCPVAAALTVIEQYARHDARLPSFPPDPRPFSFANPENDAEPRPPTVLKPVATDKVPGGVLPRASDTWLAMLPFDDLDKSVSDAAKHDLIQKRRAFVEVLATVAHAGAPAFRLDASASMRRVGEPSVDPPSASNKTFWFDLMRALYAEASNVKIQEMTRSLIAMSHTRSLRFLFCVSQEVVPADLLDMLEKLLTSPVDPATVESISCVLAACGVKSESVGRFTVEIGLSFTAAKISPTLLAQLFDVLDICAQRNGTDHGAMRFCVTALRFGRDCVFQGKALDVLGQRKISSTITDIRLGDLQNAKPGSSRLGIRGVLSDERGLRRLVMTSLDGLKPIASTLRTTESHIEELDVAFEPTVESAAWLAFALFHVDSKSAVSSLRLRFPPNQYMHSHWADQESDPQTNDWLVAFKRALRSTTADQDLASLEGGDENEEEDLNSQSRRFVTIKVGTAIKAEPYASAKLLCKVEDDTEFFEAIATVGKSLAVIVPGVGIGWVSSAKVTSERFKASSLSSGASKGFQTNRKITSLAWDCASGSRYHRPCPSRTKAILEIVEIVGEPLQSLHLPALRLTNDQLAQVLLWCPNLTELNVSNHSLTSIAPLVDMYASGSCKINTLSIVSVGAHVQEDRIPREVDAILQCAHGHTLRRLAVHMIPLPGPTANNLIATEHKNEVLALTRTISTSPTLEYADLPGTALWEIPNLALRWMNGDGRVREQVPPVKLTIDVSSHPFCVAPTAMATKLAFLSCLQCQDDTSALRRLDACVLGLIFRFSGQLVARHVITDPPVVLDAIFGFGGLDGILMAG